MHHPALDSPPPPSHAPTCIHGPVPEVGGYVEDGGHAAPAPGPIEAALQLGRGALQRRIEAAGRHGGAGGGRPRLAAAHGVLDPGVLVLARVAHRDAGVGRGRVGGRGQNPRPPRHQAVAQVAVDVHAVPPPAAAERGGVVGVRRARRLLRRHGKGLLHAPSAQVNGRHGAVLVLPQPAQQVVEGQPGKGALIDPGQDGHVRRR